ncbi:hypothetical protein PV08_03144 [Exophiala spinifera]|uniref:Uncharacterized protein n=1 Tax=Exophiala spinifera TaxID=91928 RepID=A0A0D2BJT8_9EURO|nr:uncharacterized protein PV08_03144 [Exophiala spinifera]KIW18855.1 hypothetical protein PV08_03144 [Exophiala spinifera]
MSSGTSDDSETSWPIDDRPRERTDASKHTKTKRNLNEYLDPQGLASPLAEWHKAAWLYDFYPWSHIADPEGHFDWLEKTHSRVLRSSEFYRIHTKQDVAEWAHRRRRLTNVSRSTLKSILSEDSSLISSDMKRRRHDAYFSFDMDTNTTSSIEALAGSPQLEDILEDLGQSYLILCDILNTLSELTAAKFCEGSYSVLVQHSKPGIAELVLVRRSDLEDVKGSLERGIDEIAGRENSLESIMWRYIVAPICGLLGRLCFPTSTDLFRSWSPSLALCRMTCLLLDLTLITYVGSHATDFQQDLGYFENNIAIKGNLEQISGFRCIRRRLACLDGFLDSNMVWVFERLGPEAPEANVVDSPNLTPLSLLCEMSTFADLWGPVWSVSSGKSRGVQRYAVSKGFIAAVGEKGSSVVENAVPCHWYAMPMSKTELDNVGKQAFNEHDKLLIGTFLETNLNCTYNLDKFQSDYHTAMAPMGTSEASWRPDTRTLGFGFAQYVTANVSATKKLLPGVTYKQSVWDMMQLSPSEANPCFLMNWMGVEVSSCTGHARRVRLIDLFKIKRIQRHLDIRRRDWRTTAWGRSLISWQSDDMNDILDFWHIFQAERKQVAKVIRALLNMLHNTGLMGDVFSACFFTEYDERCITINLELNTWARTLAESTTSGAYVFISEKCLHPRSRGGVTPPPCTNDQGLTALETSIVPIRHRSEVPLEQLDEGGRVEFVPTGQTLTRMNAAKSRRIRLRKTNLPLNTLLRLGRPAAVVQEEVISGVAVVNSEIGVVWMTNLNPGSEEQQEEEEEEEEEVVREGPHESSLEGVVATPSNLRFVVPCGGPGGRALILQLEENIILQSAFDAQISETITSAASSGPNWIPSSSYPEPTHICLPP